MAFCIITDSASDVPGSVIEKYRLYVMPTPVVINEKEYLDGKNLNADEFYRIQQSGADISTYHISQFMFEEHFRIFAEKGDEVLYICFSTGIAGTYNAARLAYQEIKEEFPEFQMTIIDSRCASIGYGLVVEKLLCMQSNGASKELIIEAAHFFCEHMVHVITVAELDYLFKGGRLSRTSFLMGNALNIKPIIIVDENGSLKAVGRVKGWKNAQNKMLEMVGKQGKDLDRQTIGICCGTDREAISYIRSQLQEMYHVKGILETQVGCAIGAHTGAGILGIVFLNEAVKEKYLRYLPEE